MQKKPAKYSATKGCENSPRNSTENPVDDPLEQLLQLYGDDLTSKVWRGFETNKRQTLKKKHLPSGHKELDELLTGDGWPLDTTLELGLSQPGIGELRLLTPALRYLQQELRDSVVLVAPPLLPFAPAFVKEQIDVSRLIVVQTNTLADTLWSAEQALLAECCAAVISWTGNANLSTRELRRLQLAAEQSNTWNVLLRDSDCLKQSSASGLRIHLKTNAYSQLEVNILKQPQSWGGQKCTLSLHPHYENWQRLPAHLLPHRNQYQTPKLPMQLNTRFHLDQQQASVTVLAPLNSLQAVH